ncbi:YoaK family protein [Aedoeadaptatus coli]|uniref:YoaK family protein n=1 Tax=Aedoeadaptatus coli TaxID=2058292 RepID=UPI000D55FC76|nr:YoaK family protein [Peptoniphilus coli]
MKDKTWSESLLFATFLTLAGGLQDGYSYALRGKVFVNALTGNVVLMAFNLAEGNFPAMLRYFIQIAAFALGVYVSGRIAFSKKRRMGLHFKQRVLAAEIAILVVVGFLSGELDSVANSMMAFSCGMQVNTFRKFADINAATTMCVGNVRTIMHNLAGYHHTKDNVHKETSRTVLFIVGIFFIGALIGGLCFSLMGLKTIWLSAAFLAVSFLILHMDPAIRT